MSTQFYCKNKGRRKAIQNQEPKTINGIDYLVTWNCTHLANAALRGQVERFVSAAGYQCPAICTPEELMEV